MATDSVPGKSNPVPVATKQGNFRLNDYLDVATLTDALYLKLAGGTMVGDLIMDDASISISDNYNLILGDDSDSKITYDGTNLIIDPNTVGSGHVNIQGQTLLDDKLKFTQVDGNEYIDSLADGELDIGATTAINLRSDTVFIGAGQGALFTNTAGDLTITPSGTGVGVDGIIGSSAFTSVTTQFDKTEDTTLATVTGLTATVAAGKTYRFFTQLFITDATPPGSYAKIAIDGTATATQFKARVRSEDADGSIDTSATITALGETFTSVSESGHVITVTGVITVNGAGTLTVQFAQASSNATACSVLTGSHFEVIEIL